ncbi:hypothetical protein [Burkholderia metallica]|uniref:hypothetical protein n=1 Tax=Burkholderia metallica TaxID=488729 RepID=UPI001CF281B6|nr:hypothetical protein [Burkholderia metallica]MCA8017757.1 hypothetical protein [Burkholderia metallica]
MTNCVCQPGGCELSGCEGGQYCFDADGVPLPGWITIEFAGQRHVMPMNERVRHVPAGCSCVPTPDDEDPNVIVHHAFDGREAFETGERKVS